MSNEPKKRGGIGSFWDSVAPPSDEVHPPPTTAAPPSTSIAPTDGPADAPRSSGSARDSATLVQPARPRGRPPSGIIKERMTVNLDPRSLQILEALRYQARKQGQRNATFSDLLDEAVMLLAKQYKLKLEE